MASSSQLWLISFGVIFIISFLCCCCCCCCAGDSSTDSYKNEPILTVSETSSVSPTSYNARSHNQVSPEDVPRNQTSGNDVGVSVEDSPAGQFERTDDL